MSSLLNDSISPSILTKVDKYAVFHHLARHIAAYRNTAQLHAHAESSQTPFLEMDTWANRLLKNAWDACEEPGDGPCPVLDLYSDTSTRGLPHLPPQEQVDKLLTTILFLHITSTKEYSARTRSFLFSLGNPNENFIVSALKDPDQVVKEAEKQAQHAKEEQALRHRPWRIAGMGLGAVAGGVLVGVTGGLAAPIMGASLTTILGLLGVGGTATGVLITGLASSSVVCGALFGAYGARESAKMVDRHTREVKDLGIVPVHQVRDTLSVKLCVSGWLRDKKDITAPWTIFDQTQDTFALQWEVDALEELSAALITLVKAQAMKYVQGQIIKRTFLASLMASLGPVALLQIGKIIDNPWMNARALAIKTGRVLGILLASRVFGARPVTLTGYSLGSLVIFEALRYLSTLPIPETMHLVEDVFLFGLPAPSQDLAAWRAVRRIVAGRLVNGYVGADEDYVLAILSRASSVTSGWGVAGLESVAVQGVENVKCEGVQGHLEWVTKVGKSLELCHARGVDHTEVEEQLRNNVCPLEEQMQASQEVDKPDKDVSSKE